MSDYLSFHLSDDFVAQYESRTPNWGFPIGGGNSLGELTFITKYSRVKEDGTKERWHETCRRVIEGMFSIQKDWCKQHRTRWNDHKAQRTAQDAYERMFSFKWLPPGRGLWMMGTEFVMKHGSAALQNCSFVSTSNLGPRNPTGPFTFLMEASMLGVGVGFDTRGAGKLTIHAPSGEDRLFVIPDSREGWCESLDLKLRSFLLPNHQPVSFDYSLIRPEGTPIKGFGGTAAGPGPLMKLHDHLDKLFAGREGTPFDSSDIVDVANMIGKCVVAGNVRRSAELALGFAHDEAFLDLKDYKANPERMGTDGWGYLSNNSIIATVGENYDHLVDRILTNGEPGLVYLDLIQAYGRLGDPADYRDVRAVGVNPCSEQALESMECCTLVETFPSHHDSLDDFLDTLKVAYLYGKTVTLLPTHWEESNEVMTRNRRIGTSITGIAQFVENRSLHELREWCDAGYKKINALDVEYSEWLGVRESIRKTSIKPSGTVSLLAGVTPGVHWPTAGGKYLRRQRFRRGDADVEIFRAAGYHIEPDDQDPDYTVVVTFPTEGPRVRGQDEVSLWEKMALAAVMQRHWADNQVSATFTFREDERDQVAPAIRAFEGQLKAMSFLPPEDSSGYTQLPYESVDEETFAELRKGVSAIDWNALYRSGEEAEGERYCTNDTCTI